mmetsp:Transcript_130131/g.253468  ORF Transcript_130131/g.253468 Transcript_130131/m.253468 type:complete len:196 (+) Transcript_130131:77-664(+)
MGLWQQFLVTSQLLLSLFMPLGLAEGVREGATSLVTVFSHKMASAKLQEHANNLQEMRASLSKVNSLRAAEWKGTLANNIEKLLVKLEKLNMQSKTVDAQVANMTSSENELRSQVLLLSESIERATKNAQHHKAKLGLALIAIDDISAKYAKMVFAVRDAVGSYGSTCAVGAPIDLFLQTQMVNEMDGVTTTAAA